MQSSSRPVWVILIVVVVILCLCLSVLGVGAAGLLIFNRQQTNGPEFEWRTPLPDVDDFQKTPNPLPTLGQHEFPGGPTPDLGQTTPPPPDPGAEETLQTLIEAVVPINDPVELAQRLGGAGEIPATIEAPREYNVGDTESFWATNVDNNENFRVTAELAAETDHVYFWVERGIRYNAGALRDLVDTFEQEIYPTNREFFGSEWSPGIDNDVHLNILLASGLGSNLAGYFSSADSLHPLAHEYSNAREMFLMNADNVELSDEFTFGVLAHEFQHMIHWYQDRNEESWLNEGFAELAAFLNGFDIGGFDYAYMSDPDLQLNDWPNDPSATTPHYGAGFLFVAYFLDRFGEDATKALVSHDENGLDSIDAVLADLGETDPETNQPLTADDVFADWVVTNYLLDQRVEDGRFDYNNYPAAPQAADTDQITGCDGTPLEGSVHQYGVDYINLVCDGPVTLSFQGQTEVGVLPENPISGDYAFWSNKGDESDMVLSREFDFTGVDGPIEMSYQTWHDLEKDYDYLFLVASTDEGETWEIVDTPSCTSDDPSGNSYGCGYNGTTDGWIEETVDLSRFAGQKVSLAFEYVTDAAVNGEGFLLDDVSIPAVDYQSDFETDEGGWQSEGWVRIENRLPQNYRVSLIRRNGNQTAVDYLNLDQNNSFSLTLDFGSELDQAILVVSGTTRFTRQEADYRIQVRP